MNLRKEARGRECAVMIFGVCDGGTDTTVLAHLDVIGWNCKAHDFHGALSCGPCHHWLGEGYALKSTRKERDLEHLQAVIRTQQIWIDEGKIKIID